MPQVGGNDVSSFPAAQTLNLIIPLENKVGIYF